MTRNKFGWNLPPGAANDPNAPYNQPDHSHDHVWRAVEENSPVLEDGAVIFYDKCTYTEGRHGESWKCEETKTVRCDVDRVIKIQDDQPNIAYLASEEEPQERWTHFERVYEDALVAIELADFEDVTFLTVDPPNEYPDGLVRVQVDETYIVEYRQ